MTAAHEKINDPVPSRILAIDWSGDASTAGARKRIWLAEVRNRAIVRLEAGRDRAETVAHLLEEAERDPLLVVGLDFAFSLPEWFARRAGADGVAAVWRLVAGHGEEWLRDPKPPFWRARRPDSEGSHFRRTELDVTAPGIRPKSPFQLGGAGAVGTGSLRGIPFLPQLRERFAIWPFDRPRLPLVVEIYPRIFTAAGWAADLPPGLNDHARDAAASALAMAAWQGDWTSLVRDERDLLEGRIWTP